MSDDSICGSTLEEPPSRFLQLGRYIVFFFLVAQLILHIALCLPYLFGLGVLLLTSFIKYSYVFAKMPVAEAGLRFYSKGAIEFNTKNCALEAHPSPVQNSYSRLRIWFACKVEAFKFVSTENAGLNFLLWSTSTDETISIWQEVVEKKEIGSIAAWLKKYEKIMFQAFSYNI